MPPHAPTRGVGGVKNIKALKKKFLTFPCMHVGAEHLAMGLLARRNIVAYTMGDPECHQR